jgi:hypothetical protein
MLDKNNRGRNAHVRRLGAGKTAQRLGLDEDTAILNVLGMVDPRQD